MVSLPPVSRKSVGQGQRQSWREIGRKATGCGHLVAASHLPESRIGKWANREAGFPVQQRDTYSLGLPPPLAPPNSVTYLACTPPGMENSALPRATCSIHSQRDPQKSQPPQRLPLYRWVN